MTSTTNGPCELPENNEKIIIETRADIKWNGNSSPEPRVIITLGDKGN